MTQQVSYLDDNFELTTKEVATMVKVVDLETGAVTFGVRNLPMSEMGGPGSGNIGHAGIPGHQGGSAPSDDSVERPSWAGDKETTHRGYKLYNGRFTLTANQWAVAGEGNDKGNWYPTPEEAVANYEKLKRDAAEHSAQDANRKALIDRLVTSGKDPLDSEISTIARGGMVISTSRAVSLLREAGYSQKDAQKLVYKLGIEGETSNGTILRATTPVVYAMLTKLREKAGNLSIPDEWPIEFGGKGSGNHGHKGIPGHKGGSTPTGQKAPGTHYKPKLGGPSTQEEADAAQKAYEDDQKAKAITAAYHKDTEEWLKGIEEQKKLDAENEALQKKNEEEWKKQNDVTHSEADAAALKAQQEAHAKAIAEKAHAEEIAKKAKAMEEAAAAEKAKIEEPPPEPFPTRNKAYYDKWVEKTADLRAKDGVQTAINHYTGTDYHAINRYLRGGAGNIDPEKEQLVQGWIGKLTEYTNGTSMHKDSTVFRGDYLRYDRPNDASMLALLEKKASDPSTVLQFSDPGFFSTSFSENTAQIFSSADTYPGRKIMFEIQVPKGVKCAPAYNVGNSEQEVIFPPSAKFIITSAEPLSDSGYVITHVMLKAVR